MFPGQSSGEAVEFCSRPVVRRVYKTLVVALAVFLVTIVAFKQDFRGYLAEARLSGPVIDGLDLDEAAEWVKKLDPKIAAVANRPQGMPGKAQLRITYVAMQPHVAAGRVDELAERWLYQYLPDRLQAYRHSELAELRSMVSAARQREDQARQQLDLLRQTQLVQLQASNNREIAPVEEAASQAGSILTASRRNDLIQKLGDLRLAISALSSERTAEHPRVRTLQLEATALEEQLGLLPGQALPIPTPNSAPQFVSHEVSRELAASSIAEMAEKMNAALAELAEAARDRQTAEYCFSERLQDITSATTSVHWAKAGAVSITRLGGTPRCSTLTLAGILALVAGIVTFRAGRFELIDAALESTTEVASTLELPVVGNLGPLRGYQGLTGFRVLSPRRMRVIVRISEIVVAIAAAACVLAIAFEPSLARQVLADPFGALSEVLGRFGI